VSNILTAVGKQFDCLPKLEKYPGGVCWLSALDICPYGDQCTFAAGHVVKGNFTDAQAEVVVAALQPGVTAMETSDGPPSPTGKHKFSGKG
jgi:hypothetical protein